MRLVEVARKLGMTGQSLRKELAEVDFGVKTTDREIPDQIANGVIRYLSRKYGIEVKEFGDETTPHADAAKQDVPSEAPVAEEEAATKEEISTEDGQKVHVLRKLTLEDVSDSAVRRHTASSSAKRPQHTGRSSSGSHFHSDKKKSEHLVQEQIKKKEGVVELPDMITVKEFAEKTGVQVPLVISTLMKNGVMATINQTIDFDTAAIVAGELDVQVSHARSAASVERLLTKNIKDLLHEDDPSVLAPRPPIVTVMGHVDHGKTAILDAIRKTDVASGEAGGITQKIGATQVEHDGKRITFLDTPGHEAFTAMRARGAQITDIVVLVVAAEEGIKPTTIEAIAHAKEAGVPILVAINKIDKEGADPDRVKGELAAHELQPEEWGGKTQVVLCSAKTGQGIQSLLDHIILLAEMQELTANPDRSAVATVIESHLDSSLGPVASLIVNGGTLRVGDVIVCGRTYGRVKSMTDARGARLPAAGPSDPVRIAGLSLVPETGDFLQVMRDENEAKKMLAGITDVREREKKRGLGDLITRISEGKLTMLKIVLKADSAGELEALQSALSKVKGGKGVVSKVIHAAVGNVSESDVSMAMASDGLVLGFNVTVSSHVESIAKNQGVQVRLYDVIYKLLEDVEGLLAGLVESEEEERVAGHLTVLGVFFRKHGDQVIGGKVTDGTLKRLPFRLLRDGNVIGEGRITSLRSVDKDVKEAKEGKEYGLRVDSTSEIQVNDVLEAYVRELKKRR